MSTNARIGMTTDAVGSSVRSIYTHWDGYLSHHGPILLDHYRTAEKVRALLDLGDLSSLAAEIGEQHDFDTHLDTHPSWNLAYGRDRGETETEARTHDPLEWPDSGQEFEYLFADGSWQYRTTYPEPGEWKTLDVAAIVAELQESRDRLASDPSYRDLVASIDKEIAQLIA